MDKKVNRFSNISNDVNINLDSNLNNNNQYLIECRIEFVKMGGIDTVKEKFKATIKLRSKWYEKKIIEDYDPKKHWNPKIYIENSISSVNYFQDVSYKTKQLGEITEITEIRTIKGEFWERME